MTTAFKWNRQDARKGNIMTAAEIRSKAIPEKALTFAVAFGDSIIIGDFVPAEKLADTVAWDAYGEFGKNYWIISSPGENPLYALAHIPENA